MNEFHGSPLEFTFTTPMDTSKLPPLRTNGDGVLKTFGFQPARLWADMALLLVLLVLVTVLAYAALVLTDEIMLQRCRRCSRGRDAALCGPALRVSRRVFHLTSVGSSGRAGGSFVPVAGARASTCWMGPMEVRRQTPLASTLHIATCRGGRVPAWRHPRYGRWC